MQKQSVRAEIVVSGFIFRTPYVKSFNVTRQRGTFWSSATASIELPKGQSTDFVGGGITITVIVDGVSKQLFTGYVDKIDVTPSQSRYSSVMMSLTAYDKLYRLHNLKVNRRLQLAADKLWCAITGLVRHNSVTEASLVNMPGYSVVVRTEYMGLYNPFAELSTTARPVMDSSVKSINISDDTAASHIDSGVPAHTHESFSQGGPAIGVFGDYKLYTDR